MSYSKILFLCFTFVSSLSAAETIRIHGSNTVGAKLMPAIVDQWLTAEGLKVVRREYVAENELELEAKGDKDTILVSIHAHGSGTAFKGLGAGSADFGMASRPAKSKEVRALSTLGDITESGKEIVLGLDGIAVVVHPQNPIAQLSIAQLRQIFSGAVTNWQAINGVNAPINVYARDNKSGTYDTFKSLVLGKKSPLVANAKRYESNDVLSDDVSGDIYGIGFTGLPSIRQSKALAISDGGNPAILPSQFSVATEDYPLSRRLYVYSPFAFTEGYKRKFYAFLNSQNAQVVVGNIGFIAQEIAGYDIQMKAHYPQEYAQVLTGAKRLSLNFRFETGEYKLDNKALQDVDRLVSFVTSGDSLSRVYLAGFSDGAEASAWRSLILSMERSDYVAEQLIKKGVIPEVVRGFGSAVQVANNESEKGRAKNRRVEVWVK